MPFTHLTPTFSPVERIVADTITITGQASGTIRVMNAWNVDDGNQGLAVFVYTQLSNVLFDDLNNTGCNIIGTSQLTDNTGTNPLNGIVFIAFALDGTGLQDRYGVNIVGDISGKLSITPADGSGTLITTLNWDDPFTFEFDMEQDFINTDGCLLTIRNANTNEIIFQRAMTRSTSNTGQGSRLFGVQSGSSSGADRYSKHAGWVITKK